MKQSMCWSVDNSWDAINARRERKDIDEAYVLARQLIDGTLPHSGVIACESSEAAQRLLTRVKHWMAVLTPTETP